MRYRQQIKLTNAWIKRYAQSIGAPLQQKNNAFIAPSTMPAIFWQCFPNPPLHNCVVIHGSQQFIYSKPLVSGMVLDCELTLVKRKKLDTYTFFVFELTCKYNNCICVVSTTTLKQVGVSTEVKSNK